MRYTVNANTFMQLPYTTGTVQNISNTDIEISNEQVIGTGIILKAGETFAFDNATIYACARPVLDGGTGIISVVPFNAGGRGGESPIYVPKGSVAFTSLPSTLNSTMLGWTYNVSDAFTTDSRFVEGSGIDYPAGENVVVVEPSTGVFKYDCFGGAYILPVANTTTLGGVKSSATDGNVSVDNDGVMTINLPTASTTVKGGVLSSTDEGNVTVNNDGTMTYNPLGYRQPSTAYTAGQIAYHSALPTGRYLECTTEGTSGSGELTISTTTVGTTVSDGTVVWTIRQGASTTDLSGYLPLAGGTVSGDLIVTGTINGTSSSMTGRLNLGGLYLQDFELKRNNNTSRLSLSGGNQSAYMNLYGKECTETNNQSAFAICAHNGTISKALLGKLDGSLLWDGNDLAGSAIVAKSLGANGYIKYASGLIVQWGWAGTNESGTVTVNFPVTFSSGTQIYRPQITAMDSANNFYYIDNDRTNTTFVVKGTASKAFAWLAVGV